MLVFGKLVSAAKQVITETPAPWMLSAFFFNDIHINSDVLLPFTSRNYSKLICCNGPFPLQPVYEIDVWDPVQCRLLWYMLKRL